MCTYACRINYSYTIQQDAIWGYALLISGLFCAFMVYRFGGERYRNEIVNKVNLKIACMIVVLRSVVLIHMLVKAS